MRSVKRYLVEKHVGEGVRSKGAIIPARNYKRNWDRIRTLRNKRERMKRKSETPENREKKLMKRRMKRIDKFMSESDDRLKIMRP